MDEPINVRGNHHRIYDTGSLAVILKDYLDSALYKKIIDQRVESTPDKIIPDNQNFWRFVSNGGAYPSQLVKLTGFRILEWIPTSPGLFFTEYARDIRQAAMYRSQFYDGDVPYVNVENRKVPVELRPDEKRSFVLGGYGSMRLGSKMIRGREMYVMCASSNGISHQGIPIVIDEYIYEKIIPGIREGVVPVCDVIGKLKVLPTELSVIDLRYGSDIPKYYIEVEELQNLRHDRDFIPYVSVSITYARQLDEYFHDRFAYSFCTFSPSKNNRDLREAVNWLQHYAIRYSRAGDPVIVGDFDESFDHFGNVVFPIKDVANGRISVEKLNQFRRLFHFEIGEVIMGDKFENITNSTIVNRSKVENSFNSVRDKFDEETANAIVQIAEIVDSSDNQEAGELFDAFNDEINKPEPKKSLLKSFWSGLTATLPILATTAGIAEKVMKIIG